MDILKISNERRSVKTHQTGRRQPTSRIPGLVLAAVVAGLAPLGSACYVGDVPPPAYADGYQPQYYDGYVVYYDDTGRPFYHLGAARVWVPETSPLYIELVNDWRLHGPAFRDWNARYGDRYRTYRGASHGNGHRG